MPLNKAQVLARLCERHAQIAAIPFDDQERSTREAVQRTLEALDRPDSNYVVLSEDERAHARAQWQALCPGPAPKRVRAQTPKPRLDLPAKVHAFFGDADCIPHWPRAADDYSNGVHRMSWKRAQNLLSVELNPPAHVYWLIFDCDHTEHERWKSQGLLQPSFVTINPCNGHHHVAYRLRAPVCRSERARYRPLAYLGAVQGALREALKADPNYAGMLTKNPLHSAWVTIVPKAMPSYGLSELAATVDIRKSKQGRKSDRSSLAGGKLADLGKGGRNRGLFDAVRTRPTVEQDIHAYAQRCNALLADPLGANEVASIAKSIERWESNVRRPLLQDRFRALQAARGKKGGRPRSVGDTRPWVAAGISRSTWYRQRVATSNTTALEAMPRPGRPVTTKDSRPWEVQGVSRATWYRRQQATSVLN